MKEIPLTQGKVALVDDEDYERINAHKWYAIRNRGENIWYARRNIPRRGKQTTIKMHREITNAPLGTDIDHRDGDGLNNRKANLRPCTHAQNQQNQGKRSNNICGYKGVQIDKQSGKFRAQIRVVGARMHLGLFDNPTEAGAAYATAALKYHGEFARV